MNNFKFTGVNIAAALLIIVYFFPWVDAGLQSMSGFTIASNGVSPGILSSFISGMSRFLMILTLLIPVSGAIILYQNVTGNKKFDKFYKAAHIVPALYLILGIVFLYFKMKPDTSSSSGMFGEVGRSLSRMTPGAFDILSFGVYLSLFAAIYLALVSMGKLKDKEYYKPASSSVRNNNSNPDQTNNP